MASHLSLDLTGVKARVVKDHDESAVSAASADYDLFVTSTYMSRLRPQSRRSAYVCFFPTPPDHELTDRQRTIAHAVGDRIRPAAEINNFGYGTGWFPPEGGLRQKWSWSNGHGVLELPHGGDETFRLTLGRPGLANPAAVTITDRDGGVIGKTVVDSPFRSIEVTVPASEDRREVHIESDTDEAPGDDRPLGVALSRGNLASRLAPPQLLARRFPYNAPCHRAAKRRRGASHVLPGRRGADDPLPVLPRGDPRGRAAVPPLRQLHLRRGRPAAEETLVAHRRGRRPAPQGRSRRHLRTRRAPP
jgi:hypothetical protein